MFKGKKMGFLIYAGILSVYESAGLILKAPELSVELPADAQPSSSLSAAPLIFAIEYEIYNTYPGP